MAIPRCGKFLLPAALALLASRADAGTVRMIGVQLAVDTAVYASSAAYARRLDEAVTAGLATLDRKPGDQVIVVLPEHIGTFLAFVGEDPRVLTAPSRAAVVAKAFLGNGGLFRYHLASVLRSRSWKAFQTYFALTSLLRYKAAAMWKIYTETGSALAAKHRVILVAGSISSPRVEEMALPLAPVYGTSAVFGPDGSLLGIVRKLHPVMEETLFLTPAPAEELRPVATPAGRLGVLICSDSWYPDVYERLKDSDFLAAPSLGEGGLEVFGKTVKAFDGKSFEEGSEPGHPTVRDTWFQNGLVGRIAGTRASGGVQPFLTGRLWDMETGGPGVSLLRRGEKFKLTVVESVKGSDTFVTLTAPLRRARN